MESKMTVKYVLEITDSWTEEFTDVEEAFKRFDEVRSPMGIPQLTTITTIVQDITSLADLVNSGE